MPASITERAGGMQKLVECIKFKDCISVLLTENGACMHDRVRRSMHTFFLYGMQHAYHFWRDGFLYEWNAACVSFLYVWIFVCMERSTDEWNRIAGAFTLMRA
eukprot:1143871-Pelagomonas_calceolata.AAC.5